jgi:hypothetical protein
MRKAFDVKSESHRAGLPLPSIVPEKFSGGEIWMTMKLHIELEGARLASGGETEVPAIFLCSRRERPDESFQGARKPRRRWRVRAVDDP